VHKYGLRFCAAWTLTILILTTLTLLLHHNETIKDAEHEARDFYALNLQYRAWNARAGGIYAPADRIPPNPHLTVPDRDIISTDGRKLTLVNPAYMTRMVFDAIRTQPGQPVISKLISLKPVNPHNTADEWESRALLSFEQGRRKGVSQVIDMDGLPYLRLISPFVTEPPCLKCHAVQGYKVGDIRGGISIAVPLAHYYKSEALTRNYFICGYFLLWITGITGIARGSARRFNGEIALRESERKYRSLFESMQEGFALHEIICSEDGRPADYRFIEVNPAFERQTGLKREKLIGHTIREVLPDIEEKWITNYGEVALHGNSKHFEDYSEALKRHFEVDVFCPAPRQFATIFSDVTERRLLRDEALKAQKLESLGILAGGIAHDFNNILTAIIGNLSVARMQLPGGVKISTRLEECELAASRAAELIRQLLYFSRGGEPLKQPVDTKRLVREAASLAIHGSNCIIEYDTEAGLWWLNADASQIHQLISNLVINAVQAMPDGGSIFIKAVNTMIEMQHSVLIKPGRYVTISITDQGVGIPEENLGKIFDPYFTTKSSGSGLGLASVYSIIKRHGGAIRVSSPENGGAVFSLLLPATDANPVPASLNKQLTVNGKKGSVLLMDDERMIREMAKLMLGELGYTSETCDDGAAAIQLYKAALERREPFDAVILDMTVPGGMGGKQAAEEILTLDPAAVLIISSGYSVENLGGRGAESLFRGAVAKPYNARQLDAELKRLIHP